MGAIFNSFSKYAEVLTPGSLFLEIGTDRGLKRQEYAGSTKVLKELADLHHCEFVTIDIDNDLLQPARDRGVDAYCMSGEQFCLEVLPEINRPVSMAYLDNFDWDWNPPKNDPFIKDQQDLYKRKYGIEMNNVASQAAHVMQTMYLLPYLADECVIGFDDTFYMPHLGHYTGKGASAVPLLLSLGFQIVEEHEEPVYGLLMKR